MKKILTLRLFLTGFLLIQVAVFAQNEKVKIFQSKSDDACLIVFPNSPEPLMVMTSSTGGCTVVKTMAADDWTEMSSSTVVTTCVAEPKPVAEAVTRGVKSPRDAASGLATGKRQHKPIMLSSLTLDALDPDSDGDGIEVYSFSWGMSNAGAMSSGASASNGKKAGYNVKENVKRTVSPGGGCCSDGVCTVTVSVDKKHTKSGHVTLLK
ncbi:hypothetical protein NAT51_13215 [Flavobacterium amniphilum]|uniref:hypothetical protein n=1 Tax=Flavobacterium amniphilum TaxID=1834035 RepID=UPI002029F36E|nr:hypothetical protein [Flavobacterium amniphilum]MCL9806490.1 hypothetical protein [Flavobacterium amniphilum]